MQPDIVCVTSAANDLGESRHWDAAAGIFYVTSASRLLDEAQLRAQPLAGRVFAIHGLGARGLPEPNFAA